MEAKDLHLQHGSPKTVKGCFVKELLSGNEEIARGACECGVG